jgi:hypothetical protein
MTKPRHLPVPDDPARLPPGGTRTGASHPVRAALVALAAVILGTALLGAAAGWLWATLAPRALAVVAGRGSANVVNPETGAFIAADAWFTLVTAGGGVISGLLGYALAVRRHGALAMTGILAGGLAATLIAMWIGQRSGAAAFSHSLAIGRPGTLLRVPLMLGGRGPLAFWPLAAGLTAGGSEVAVLLRERRRRAAPLHAYPPPARYGLPISSTGSHGHAGHNEHPAPDGASGQHAPGQDGPPRFPGPREPGPATDPGD